MVVTILILLLQPAWELGYTGKKVVVTILILLLQPAWELGYTGKKVVVTILDDGIQYNHPDLQQNYDPLASKVLRDVKVFIENEQSLFQQSMDFSSISKFTGVKANTFFPERNKQRIIANADILPLVLNMRLYKPFEKLSIERKL